jgi:hypothetical protein
LISLIALAIWTQRGDRFEDGDNLSVVSDRFRSEYHITDAEASAFFSDDVEAPEPIFGDEPVRSDALIDALFAIAPRRHLLATPQQSRRRRLQRIYRRI